MLQNQPPVTLLDFLTVSTDYLQSKGIDDARLNVQLMLCHILKIDKIALYMKYDYPLAESEISTLRDFLKRRINREPLQHILGETQFLDFTFKVSKDVLIPRPETEELVDYAVKELKKFEYPSILEIGTGSGIIPISMARYLSGSRIVAVDISEEAILIAKKNAFINKVENQIDFQIRNFLTDDFSGQFDCIISNPPYISKTEVNLLEPEVKNYEPHIALTDGNDGLDFYRKFKTVITENLKPGGFIFLELNESLAEETKALLESVLTHSEIILDMQNKPRIFKGVK